MSLSFAEAAASQVSNVGKLLIVDDLADNRAVLTRRFVRRGFEVVEAESGEEALRLIREHAFDTVLLDMMMPGMDGNETLAQIRRDYPATTLPVIMVTAKSQSEDVVASLKLGANDYVTKPVDFGVALARVVNQIAIRKADLELRRNNDALEADKTRLEQQVSERGAMLAKANAVIEEEAARRTASEDRISFLARHDGLTGLPNRFGFDERFRESCRTAGERGSQLSLLFIDLDGFKNVNDTLGHGVGDELLRDVAAKISGLVGPHDFCARFGGDEFAIVHLSEDAQTTAAKLAHNAITAIAGCHVVVDSQVFIGASIGIAVMQDGKRDAATLLKQADLAMYRAKAEGRGVFRFFEKEMADHADTRRRFEIDLRRAITQGEFQSYYQPIVDLNAGKVVGVEALIRWNHPTRGFVPPGEFISLAEETGLIMPIGEWMLRQACAEAAQWPEQIRLAINLSPVQFRDRNLVTVVMRALSSSGLPPHRLELEVTESVMLANNSQNLQILEKLRDLGVHISLDDFGTGYSGIGYLRNFRFDRIKIDQSFVREMLAGPESRAIIRAAIGLSKNMGICATAEGVETVEQLEYLLREGCSVVQGYLFSKPRPGADIARTVDEIGIRFEGLTRKPVAA